MTQNYISVIIEGNFINSYLYKGTLFLKDTNAVLSAYKWNDLLNDVLTQKDSGLILFLKGESKNLKNTLKQKIEISKETLHKHKTCHLSHGVCANDIGIFNDNIYIASEKGLSRFNFDDKTGKIIPDSECVLWDKYTYNISHTSFGRFAISTGENGVVVFIPDYQNNSFKTKIIEAKSYDCEWKGKYLAVNTEEYTLLLTYSTISGNPKRTIIKDVLHSCIDVDKLLSISNKGTLESKWIDSEKSSTLITDLPIDSTIACVKSCLFGTIAEIGDQLLLIDENGINEILTRPVNWCTFSQDRYYNNQLHIIENEFIEIRAYNA